MQNVFAVQCQFIFKLMSLMKENFFS